MKNTLSKKTKLLFAAGLIVGISVFSGCQSEQQSSGGNVGQTTAQGDQQQGDKKIKKITLAHAGTSPCEAPIFSAETKGFFEKEGLDVELVKMDFETLKNGIASGKVDATVGNFAWFKPIEQGLDVKLTGGLHAGCIQAATLKSSGIKEIKDLKGKRIGIDLIGGGPQITLTIQLKKAGIDPKKDVEWKVYPGPQLATAAEKVEIDAFITWDPAAQKALDTGKFHRLLSNAHDEPFKSGYCCYSVISGRLAKADPETAAALTRALLKAADWVGHNTGEAGHIVADAKHVPVDAQEAGKLIGGYHWKPGVLTAEESVKFFIKEQKEQGILEPTTDEKELFERMFFKAIPDYNGH
ncbi:ABC transporter substrate-binding protein [Aeribacillus sp. FSL K6-2848]|uniref:ABC transporter substrate-binding protein n=1 Tax=Aeribacillus sp. FSL K6-2848 TaxID=2954612 RepID=UPI0030FBBCC4